MSAEAVDSSEDTNIESLWARAEIVHGRKACYTVQAAIPVHREDVIVFAFIETEEADPAGAKIIIPLASRREPDKFDFPNTKAFANFCGRNQRILGITESVDIESKALSVLGLSYQNMLPFRLGEVWEKANNGSPHFSSSLSIYGQALSFREIFSLNPVQYVPRKRSLLLAKRIGQLKDWEINPSPAELWTK